MHPAPFARQHAVQKEVPLVPQFGHVLSVPPSLVQLEQQSVPFTPHSCHGAQFPIPQPSVTRSILSIGSALTKVTPTSWSANRPALMAKFFLEIFSDQVATNESVEELV
jgi:hypothetical protein